jgi:hypothetical protein
MDRGRAAEIAAALGIFRLSQVAFTRAGAQDLAARGDFEPLGHGLLRFNAFGTSHNQILLFKKSAQYRYLTAAAQVIIFTNAFI